MHEVYKDGAADKDGRIKPGDMIVTVDGKAMKECTHKDALRVLRVTKDKVCLHLLYYFLSCHVLARSAFALRKPLFPFLAGQNRY